MIELRFTPQHIEDWAAFSGDRNPIHFDRHAARRLGVDDVVVHGMLPLLHVQSIGYRTSPAERGWRIWRARLKRPLLCERTATLKLDGGGARFSLSDEGGDKLFHGRLSAATADEPLAEPEEETAARSPLGQPAPVSLSADAVRARARELHQRLPAVAEQSWVVLSAIAFSEFLRQGLQPLRRAAVERVLGGRELADLEAGVIAVQTSHAVKFDDAALACAPHELPACEIQFDPLVAYGIERGCSGTAHLKVLRDGQSVLQMSIGLLLRVVQS